jgi:hypothetical protein
MRGSWVVQRDHRQPAGRSKSPGSAIAGDLRAGYQGGTGPEGDGGGSGPRFSGRVHRREPGTGLIGFTQITSQPTLRDVRDITSAT